MTHPRARWSAYTIGSTLGRGPTREGLVDPRELSFTQEQLPGSCILGGVLRVSGPGNREEGRPPDQEPQRDLTGGGVVRSGDFLQHAAAIRV
jgi:hypothetical protein